MDYIGPYRLLKLIRSGSRTHVWEAMNSADNQRVAIKSLQPDYRKDRQELTALKHEYEVGSSLDHANINRVFEFDVTRGVPYVVMDYFNAPNLKQSIRQFPDRVRENLVSIVEQAAAGLQHLHERGWIHRDIKPDNYLMDETCEVRLIDFAISQKIKKKSALGSLFGGKAPIVGTRSYMSPEQIKGEHLEPSSDIYSLGCVIFESLLSTRPVYGEHGGRAVDETPAQSATLHRQYESGCHLRFFEIGASHDGQETRGASAIGFRIPGRSRQDADDQVERLMAGVRIRRGMHHVGPSVPDGQPANAKPTIDSER